MLWLGGEFLEYSQVSEGRDTAVEVAAVFEEEANEDDEKVVIISDRGSLTLGGRFNWRSSALVLEAVSMCLASKLYLGLPIRLLCFSCILEPFVPGAVPNFSWKASNSGGSTTFRSLAQTQMVSISWGLLDCMYRCRGHFPPFRVDEWIAASMSSSTQCTRCSTVALGELAA